MSDDELFDSYNDLSWEDIGRLNQDAYVEDPSLEDSPVVMDDQFELRSREIERRPPGMQNVAVTPLRNGPWSGNNQLGIQQGFAPDANNFQTILKLDEWGMPEPWTICLGMDYDIQAYAAEDIPVRLFDVTAVITFGVGGTTQEVEVDWLNGSSITLPMNAVNVRAFYSFPAFGESSDAGSPPADLRLRVTLCKGPLPNCRPTRSYFFPGGTEDDGFPDLLLIPPFAKEVIISGLSSPSFYTQDAVISFVSDPTGLGAVVTISQYRLSQLVSYFDTVNQVPSAPLPLPVPPYARAITLTGDLTTRGCTVQFLLGV